MNTVALFEIVDVSKVKRKSQRLSSYNKSYFTLSCRINGEGVFFHNEETFFAKKGDILCIPHGCSYSQETKGEEVIYIHLTALSPFFSEFKICISQSPEHICDLFKKCCSEFEKKEKNYEFRCMSILYDILSHTDFITDKQTLSNNTLFNSAVHYLNTHIFNTDFNIDSLCKKCLISRTYFNKLFMKYFKVTPISYINTTRISKAKNLIDSGSYTNEEIALLCGFNNVKYFYVIFKKITGLTTYKYKTQTNRQ